MKLRLTESKLNRIISETVRRVLREEKEVVTLEHYVEEARLIALNTRSIYDTMAWCANAIMKKVRRGVEPSFEQLVNSSTIRSIQREVLKIVDNSFAVSGSRNEILYAVRECIANEILDLVDDMR